MLDNANTRKGITFTRSMHTSIQDIRGFGFSLIDKKKGIQKRDRDLLAYDLRKWKAHFGSRTEVCLIVWRQIKILHPEARMIHFFMTLYFLKTYSTVELLGSRFGLDQKTVRKWVWKHVYWIAELSPKLVSSSKQCFMFTSIR